MDQNRSYIFIGAFVLIGLLGAALFAIWLGSARGGGDYRYYQIRFHESVNGLGNGSSVKYRGVEVGNVVALSIDLAETNTIIARIRVTEGAPVKQDTVATLKMQGITGTSYIELSGGEADQPQIVGSAADKGPLPEIPSKFSDIATLSNQVPDIIDKTSHIATQAEHLMDDENVAHIHSILEQWDKISTVMEQQSQQMDALVKTANHLLQTTDQVMTQIDQAHVGDTLKDLRQTTVQLNQLVANTTKASQDSFESFDQFLADAKQTSQAMRNLTNNLNDNPSQIIFPSRDKQEKLP